MDNSPKETRTQPILITVIAFAAGLPLGLWLRRNLASLSYRSGDEHDQPQPGSRRWVVLTSALSIGALAAAALFSSRPLAYLPMFPLAISGPWLAAVDFDVLRIPNRVLAPTAGLTLLAVVGVAVATRDWQTLAIPVVGALLSGAAFASVHFATKGGIGFGDVKLAALMGLAVGSLGAVAIWLSVLTGSVVALFWTRTKRRVGPIPYGPWLLCGAWMAALARIFAPG